MWPVSDRIWGYEVTAMKKTLLCRGLVGLPLGVALGQIITLIISACVGDGRYYPVAPELTEAMGGELYAVLLQTALCAVMGSGFAMASVIWQMDTWSLARQSGVYFLVSCVLLLPIAYAANWMKHTIGGVLGYIGVFVACFLVVWLLQYLAWQRKIRVMNDRIGGDGGAS